MQDEACKDKKHRRRTKAVKVSVVYQLLLEETSITSLDSDSEHDSNFFKLILWILRQGCGSCSMIVHEHCRTILIGEWWRYEQLVWLVSVCKSGSIPAVELRCWFWKCTHLDNCAYGMCNLSNYASNGLVHVENTATSWENESCLMKLCVLTEKRRLGYDNAKFITSIMYEAAPDWALSTEGFIMRNMNCATNSTNMSNRKRIAKKALWRTNLGFDTFHLR